MCNVYVCAFLVQNFYKEFYKTDLYTTHRFTANKSINVTNIDLFRNSIKKFYKRLKIQRMWVSNFSWLRTVRDLFTRIKLTLHMHPRIVFHLFVIVIYRTIYRIFLSHNNNYDYAIAIYSKTVEEGLYIMVLVS